MIKPLPRRRAGVLADVIEKRSNGSKWECISTVRVVIISTVTEQGLCTVMFTQLPTLPLLTTANRA